MRDSVAFLLFGSLASSGAVASSPESAQWQLTTSFAIPTATDQCVALATFRSDSETLLFALESRPTTDRFAVRVAAPGNLGKKPWVEGTYSLGSAKLERDLVLVEPAAAAATIIYQLKVQRGELNSAGDSPQLRVQAKPSRLNLDLQVPGVDTAISLLDQCASSLLEKWGYSKDFQRNLANYPRPERSLSTYATNGDYPQSALMSGAMGETHVLVTVGANQRASDCRVIRSSGHSDAHTDIDAMTCKIVTERVRYEPGRTLDGNPVAAPAYLTMRWELPQ